MVSAHGLLENEALSAYMVNFRLDLDWTVLTLHSIRVSINKSWNIVANELACYQQLDLLDKAS